MFQVAQTLLMDPANLSRSASFVKGMIESVYGKLEAAEEHFIEAQNIWLQGYHARFHPFNGGCMYKIGVCCLAQGKTAAARCVNPFVHMPSRLISAVQQTPA